ncbi:MAG: dTMP kinase [Bacteroidia bacterium]
MSKKPLFIVIEGVDGSGKSTQIELLKSNFRKVNRQVLETHEPTDGPVGILLKNIMTGRIVADPSTTAALFLADRLDHITNSLNGMKKRLDEGFNIICSRYYFSSYAFQSEYVPIDWIVLCNSLCKTYLKPDLIFYLNVDPNVCISRINKGRADKEIYENLKKITDTHKAYLKVFKDWGEDENIHVVDGEQSTQTIAEEIWKITGQHMD